ncbi:MAG: thioesterase family protein [Acidimicrobiales bacterium]|nr:thioesterase family protein [Acidimicrobiales bacterium]MDP6297844.1 thioesterase family protein [Acidimicrobiales bacterium]
MHSSISLHVRFFELDPYSHVNHSVYVQYFEDARVSALSQIGQKIDLLISQDIALVIAEIQTRFLAPAVLGDELIIESGISEIRRVSATWLQRIRKGPSTIATQKTRIGCTSLAGIPKKFPDDLIRCAQEILVPNEWLD